MSFRTIVAILVDLVLGGLLIVLAVTHASLVFNKNGVGMVMPQYKLVVPIIVVMVVVTTWWLLGRSRRKTA